MHSYHSPEDLEPLSRTDPDLWREKELDSHIIIDLCLPWGRVAV